MGWLSKDVEVGSIKFLKIWFEMYWTFNGPELQAPTVQKILSKLEIAVCMLVWFKLGFDLVQTRLEICGA